MTYSWLGIYTRRLREYHSLRKLDAAYSNGRGSVFPDPQYSRLDGRHVRPCRGIVGVVDSNSKGKNISTLISSRQKKGLGSLGMTGVESGQRALAHTQSWM